MHRLFYFRIDQTRAGQYRQENMIITGTGYVPPDWQDVPRLMQAFSLKFKPDWHPIEHAAQAHDQLVNIHPFIDGNGRTARLLMNLILLRAGYPIVMIPALYRVRYIEASKAGNRGKSKPFVSLLTEVTEQSLRNYLRLIEGLG